MPKYYYRNPKKSQKKRPLIIILIAIAAAIVAAALVFLLINNDGTIPEELPSPSPNMTITPTATEFEPTPTLAPETTALPNETPDDTQLETLRPAQPSAFYNTLYEAEIHIDEQPNAYVINCDLLLRYKNRTQTEQYALYLKLIPNFYAQDSVSIEELSVNGMQAYFSLNEAKTTLMIPFTSELLPDEGVSVYMNFTVNLSKSDSPFISAEELDLSYILPMVAKTNSRGEWNTADTGLTNYRMTFKADGNVLIHCPEGMTVVGAEAVEGSAFSLVLSGAGRFEIMVQG